MLTRAPAETPRLRWLRARSGTTVPARKRSLLWADRWLAVTDAALVVVAYVLAYALHFGPSALGREWPSLPVLVLVAVLVYLSVHAARGVYGAVWWEAGSLEAWKLLVASSCSTLVLVVVAVVRWPAREVPLAVPLEAGALALLLFTAVRFRGRVLAGRLPRRFGPIGTRVVIVGTVEAARPVVHQMRTDSRLGYLPVAVVTDEVDAWNRELSGVPVLGPLEQLGAAACLYRAEQALLVPGRDGVDQAQRVSAVVAAAGLTVKTLPGLDEAMSEAARLQDVRDLSVADLLGREQVRIEDEAVRRTLAGRRVLITGAGGSIGSEIAVQVSRFEPAELVLMDHDETHLHDVMCRLHGPAHAVLGDLRDGYFVDALLAARRPEVVFHAAAHKHVPVLETFPSEAVLTNVLGTRTLVEAALRHGTSSFVSISTDKAVSPTSVMGASKRLAEHLVQHLRPEGGRYCCVRFGNVLGSRGSVVPTFVRQVQEGGPVTVTHPDMERFFMTTHEAVQLVLQAAAQAEGGEVFMLDMGEPVRILDLARRIIGLAGRDVEIVFTGLRPGERLNEQLHSRQESVTSTSHPKLHLVRGPLPPLDVLLSGVDELCSLAAVRDEEGTRTLLRELALLPDVIELDGRAVAAARARAATARLDRVP